jgi:ABC-2 type transport system ATP-binding protein
MHDRGSRPASLLWHPRGAAKADACHRLAGAKGAGTSTTIRMLTCQINPDKGSASVAGCNIVKERTRLKTRIGIVFDEPNLYERLSARLNLAFCCWLYGVPESRIDEVLDLVSLRERAADAVGTFSNGMKQRLLIARALLHHPQVLFLDEPSRGLDPMAASDLRQTIARLSSEGMTVLLTTQVMEEADQLCAHVAFLIQGRIVANDTPLNLKLAHGQRKLVVTLALPASQPGKAPALTERTLSMDTPADQAQLEQWTAQGSVKAIHSREATREFARYHPDRLRQPAGGVFRECPVDCHFASLADLLHGQWPAGCPAGPVHAWQHPAGHRHHPDLDGHLSDRQHPLAPSPDDGHSFHLKESTIHQRREARREGQQNGAHASLVTPSLDEGSPALAGTTTCNGSSAT